MAFTIGMVLGALVFSFLVALLAHIRDSRPTKTVYEVWLEQNAKDNVVQRRKDFSKMV